MIIRCPSCGSTYDISKQPQAAGRKVKCMRCSHVWKAEPVDAAAPLAQAQPEPAPMAAAPMPPPPPSEIAVPRPPVMPARSAEANSMPGLGAGGEMEAPLAPAPKARNGFNGLNGDHRGNGHAAEESFDPPPPLAPAPRRQPDFDDPPPATRRQAAPPQADAGYFDEAPAPQRATRRPEPQWREPPRESYRDEAYGDFDRGYGQDEFAPARDARPRHQGPSRGRRAAAIVGWVAYLAAVGSLGAYIYAGRDQIVSWLPGAAPYYEQFGLAVNQYGLAFKDVKAEWGEVVDGQAELKISVGVENTTGQPQKVPTIVIGLKDQDGYEMAFRSADADMGRLGAGKSDKFSVILKVPAKATRAIQVRFATSR